MKGHASRKERGGEREAAPEFGDRDALSNASSLHDLQQIGTRVTLQTKKVLSTCGMPPIAQSARCCWCLTYELDRDSMNSRAHDGQKGQQNAN